MIESTSGVDGMVGGSLAVDGDSDAPTKEELDGTSGVDSELDGAIAGAYARLTLPTRVRDDADAGLATSEDLTQPSCTTRYGLAQRVL